MLYPKAEIIRSPKHRKFIASLPCVKCLSTPSVCAHLRIGTGGGVSLKPSDIYCVPLCNTCHASQHKEGEHTFWGNVEISRNLALNLSCTEDIDKAMAWIMLARPLLFK